MVSSVWVFSGGGRFPSGVFAERGDAEAWIAAHRLTGVLTRYPVDVGVYDHAVAEGWFTPSQDEHSSAGFIGAFSSASQEHHHYEYGACVA